MRFSLLIKKVSVVIIILGVSAGISKAQDKGSAGKTDYEQLFDDKPAKVSKGMITLRKMDGKVYFEFPTDLLNEKMILGTSVDATSNVADAATGEQPDYPLNVYFTQEDSTIYMREVKISSMASDSAQQIQSALKKNNLGPVLGSFDIEAVTPDSSAIVFNATDIFINDRNRIDPFGPYSGISSMFGSKEIRFKKNKSQLADVAAFEDNVTITSYLSYGISSSFLGFQTESERPATYRMKHTLVLLPEKVMRPRISDPRIGISSNEYHKISNDDNGIEQVKYTNRWKLIPEDAEAFEKGKLVEPVQPIVFYIDDTFPDAWIDHVEEGVRDWNEAFEKIGYKEVLVTRPFPKNDPDFDPNNIKYSTINYVLGKNSSVRGRRWVDPRSGEILSASVSVYQGVADRLRKSMFLQTGAADERVRTTDIPDELLGKAIRDVTARQVGHTLGLARNIGASSAIPVDSLRSPAFTQKYGITPSIMDNVNFNYIAQPGDVERGVQMTPNDLGVYDFYAVKWLYTPIPEADEPDEEVPTLRKWISEKIDDPMYRYRKYDSNSTRDPNSHLNVLGLLGNNRVKASRYAIDNLKYVFEHMNAWVDEEDDDYQFRTELNFSVINIEFYWYWRHVLANIGGIYQYRKYEGDPFPAFEVVSETDQKRSLTFLLETLEATSWMNNESINREINDINGDVQNRTLSVLFPYVLQWGVERIKMSQQKAYGNTYTPSEFLNDVFDHVWESTKAGKRPTKGERIMQTLMVSYLVEKSSIQEEEGIDEDGITSLNRLTEEDRALLQYGLPDFSADDNPMLAGDGGGDAISELDFNSLVGLSAQGSDESLADRSDTIYYLLKKNRTLLEEAVGRQSGEIKDQYEYLLFKLKKALEAG